MVQVPAWFESDIGPMWLDDPNLGVLPLDLDHGYIVTSYDFGFPEARVLQEARVVAPGTVDRTTLHGARTVALAVSVREGTAAGFESRKRARDRLQAYCVAGRYPTLYFDEDNDGDFRRIRLSGRQAGAAISSPGSVTIPCQWSAPDGVIESADAVTVTASTAQVAQPGLSFPITLPMSFPAGSPQGSVQVVNEGTAAAAPTFRLWGPCTNPVLTLTETGDRIVFHDLALTGDQYVEIDVRDPTPSLNGRPDQSLVGNVVYDSTDFFWLPPGISHVRYSPGTFETPARAEVIYRHSWI